jgi:hypothetical protein
MAWPYHLAAWRRLRAAKLADKPLCEVCERRGKLVAADTVDHVIAIAKGGEAFPALDGLMSLCESCHNQKTARLDGAFGREARDGLAFKGCGVDGFPVDPNHPFYLTSDPAGGGGKDGKLPAETVVGTHNFTKFGIGS